MARAGGEGGGHTSATATFPAAMEFALSTRALTRRFRGGQGVHDLDLSVPTGAIYGFLGPNGAGKTTTIRLLLGLLRPDAGDVRLLGEPLTPRHRGALARVGALVEHPSLYPHLDGRANLEVTRRLLGLPAGRVDEVLERIGPVATLIERDNQVPAFNVLLAEAQQAEALLVCAGDRS